MYFFQFMAKFLNINKYITDFSDWDSFCLCTASARFTFAEFHEQVWNIGGLWLYETILSTNRWAANSFSKSFAKT